MRIIAFALFLLTLLPLGAMASEEIRILEEVSASARQTQPDLQNYRVEIVTEKVAAMISAMTLNIPADMPRPVVPRIFKYWSRQPFASAIVAEGQDIFPYMQEMVDRFSAELAVELRSLLLPPSRAEARSRLMKNARLSRVSMDVGSQQLISISIEFADPTDLNRAFYEEGLGLPQKGITKLRFDVNPSSMRVQRLDIRSLDSPTHTVEIRYAHKDKAPFPEKIIVSSPDGQIDERFTIEFSNVENFSLPIKQTRVIKRGDEAVETIHVEFRNYQLNTALPANVLKILQHRP